MGGISKVMATPAARQLAEERRIDLRGINGSGEFGSVTKPDVERLKSERKITSVARNVAGYYGVDLALLDNPVIRKETVLRYIGSRSGSAGDSDDIVEISAMRRTIAERMKQSMDVAPQYTIFGEYDVLLLMELYERARSNIEASSSVKITFTDVLIRLVSHALGAHKLINASLMDGKIHYHKDINIGIAVALSEGLTVPVVRSVQEKTIGQIAIDRAALVKKAREGCLDRQDIEGGTFTLSNLGMYPVDLMTPIINQPESAIIGIGRVVKKPVVVDDSIVIRPMMNISVTADHRLIDGATLAEFMKTIFDCINEPQVLFE